MRSLLCASAILALVTSGSEAVDRVIGVASLTEAVLCKELRVDAGMTLSGVEIVSNDLGTVFPAVRVRMVDPAGGRDGPVLAEASDASAGASGRHRFIVPLAPVFVAESAVLWVEIVLPPSGGATRVGVGPGIGAVAVDGATTSYIVNAADSELVPIDGDLCVALVASRRAGKAGASDAEPAVPTPVTALEVENGSSGFTVSLTLAARGSASVEIYDVRGNRVRRLVQGLLPAGRSEFAWDGRDLSGFRVASGVYFVVARVGGAAEVRRAVLVH